MSGQLRIWDGGAAHRTRTHGCDPVRSYLKFRRTSTSLPYQLELRRQFDPSLQRTLVHVRFLQVRHMYESIY